MVYEQTVRFVWPRPLTFDQFLEVAGPQDYVELVDGTVVEKEMVQLDHEKLQRWLSTLLDLYVHARQLGIVLGSRTPVQITRYRGRLPDLIFVRQERMTIVQQKAVFGAPDLVIEIVSPGDYASDVVALETDYRSIGVGEICFIDQRKRSVRILRRQADDYSEEVVTGGAVALQALGGLRLETAWLFEEPRPDHRVLLDALLQTPPTPNS